MPETSTMKLSKYINGIVKSTETGYFKSEDNYQFLEEIKIINSINNFFNKITPAISFQKTSFWMGPANDNDYFSLLCLIEEEKEIFLIEPFYSKFIYEISEKLYGSAWSQVDIWNIDYEKFSLFKKIKIKKIILNPGEMLYIPPFWWHAVKNIKNSIAITYHYYTPTSVCLYDIPDLLKYTFK